MKKAARWTALGLGAAGVWHVLLRLHGLGLPLIVDEGEYGYAARIWASGGLPYRDAFSQKPPNVFLFYRFAYALSSAPQAPRYLATAFSLATIWLLYAMTPKRWSAAGRLAPAAAFAVLSTTPVGDYGFVANTEVFLCFFTAAAAWALLRFLDKPRAGAALWCGLACGAAVCTKQTALWTAAGFAGLLVWRKNARALAPFAAGALAVPATWAAYFAARGGLAWLWQDAWRRNADYIGLFSDPALMAGQLKFLLARVAPAFLKGDWPAWALAALGLFGRDISREDPEGAVAAAWLGTALAATLTGLFFFPHYFLQAAPALALCAGLGVERLARARGPRLAAAAAAALALLPAAARARVYFLDPPRKVARELLYPNPLYEALDIARFIDARTAPSDTIYVFGSEGQLYLYAGRRCATEHPLSYALTTFPRPGDAEAELEKLRAAAPKAVVYSAQPMSTIIASPLGLSFRDAIRAWLAKDYVWSGRVDVGYARSAEVFGPENFRGRTPDWDAENSLFIFERKP